MLSVLKDEMAVGEVVEITPPQVSAACPDETPECLLQLVAAQGGDQAIDLPHRIEVTEIPPPTSPRS